MLERGYCNGCSGNIFLTAFSYCGFNDVSTQKYGQLVDHIIIVMVIIANDSLDVL